MNQMNQFDNYRFHRTDPTPWIRFVEPTTTRGDVAVFFICCAALILVAVGVI